MAALLTHSGPQIALLVMLLVEEGVKGGFGCVVLAFASHGILGADAPSRSDDSWTSAFTVPSTMS